MQVHVPNARLDGKISIQLVILPEMAEQRIHIQRLTPIAETAIRAAGDKVIVLDHKRTILGRLGI